jgi:hypothetical protein
MEDVKGRLIQWGAVVDNRVDGFTPDTHRLASIIWLEPQMQRYRIQIFDSWIPTEQFMFSTQGVTLNDAKRNAQGAFERAVAGSMAKCLSKP